VTCWCPGVCRPWVLLPPLCGQAHPFCKKYENTRLRGPAQHHVLAHPAACAWKSTLGSILMSRWVLEICRLGTTVLYMCLVVVDGKQLMQSAAFEVQTLLNTLGVVSARRLRISIRVADTSIRKGVSILMTPPRRGCDLFEVRYIPYTGWVYTQPFLFTYLNVSTRYLLPAGKTRPFFLDHAIQHSKAFIPHCIVM